MQKIVLLAIIGLLFISACEIIPEVEEPRNDYKVHAYYVVPADQSFSQTNANRVWRSVFEMQSWYQTATGGLTFEVLDEENIMEVYFADRESTYYEDDWWDLLLTEMKDKGEHVQNHGTIAMIWVEGINQVSENATALGGASCEGDCGAAIMPIHTIIGPTSPVVDMGLVFHEMGHALGLSHAVEEEDLPLTTEEEIMLYSVMCQDALRAGTSNDQHGFLTTEKSILISNPFLKKNVDTFQGISGTNILNYPVTGQAPEPIIESILEGTNTVRFSTNISDALLYYWNFSDGSISNEPSPTHTFSSNGLYNVSLMITGTNNMASRVNQYIQID
jgi:hypothetical protein